jgi:hypothetical protein
MILLFVVDWLALVHAVQRCSDLVGPVQHVRFGWTPARTRHHQVVVRVTLGLAVTHLTEYYYYYSIYTYYFYHPLNTNPTPKQFLAFPYDFNKLYCISIFINLMKALSEWPLK